MNGEKGEPKSEQSKESILEIDEHNLEREWTRQPTLYFQWAQQAAEESILEIDEHNLEREWTRQPTLYFRWAQQAADARLAMDEAKATVEIARAEVDSEVRADPERFGINGKLTEKAVEATISQSTACIGAVRRFGKAKHRYDIMSALVSALEQRKSALENLVRLHLANYYSEPRTPKEHREELEEMQKDRAFRPRPRRRKDDD